MAAEKTEDKNPEILIKELAKKLLLLMGFKKTEIKIFPEEGERLRLEIDLPQPGILIGNRGETLASLQLLLSIMTYKKLGRWQGLTVDAAGYLEKRKEELKELAFNAAQKVKFSGQEAVLPALNSAERRVVHLALADDPEVKTESETRDRERRLVIKPRVKK